MFEAFQVGPFIFRTYTLFLLLGVWLSSELFLRIAKREKLRIDLLFSWGPLLVAAFLIGGRLLAVILLYRVYLQQDLGRLLVFWDGEFNVVGACLGFALAAFIVLRRQREPFLVWLDALMPAMTLLLAFDWPGRFFGSLSYGKPTNVFWGVTYESMSVRYTVPIHPVQLYYGFLFLAITFLLLFLRRGNGDTVFPRVRRIGVGISTLVGMNLGCLGALFFEFLRGDFAVTVFAKLTDFLFLGLLFISLGIIAVVERRISHKFSIINSAIVGLGTVAYLLLRPFITVASVEWRFSQFLAVLAILATVVYVAHHRWKYPRSL